MGKHGFSPAQNPGNLKWLFNRIAEVGLDGVQIDPMHIESYEPEALENVKLYSKARGLLVEVGMGGCEPDRLRQRLAAAKIMGAKVLRTFVGSERPDEDVIAKWTEYAIGGLKAAAPDAKKAGIRIALENHGDFLAEELRHILEEVGSDYVGACIDTGNNIEYGEDPLHCVNVLAPYAASVHLKDIVTMPPLEDEEDAKVEYRNVPFGEGLVPLVEIVEVLKTKAPPVNIAIESVSPILESETETLAYEDSSIRESIQYARETLGIR